MRKVLSSFNKRWWIMSAEIMQSSGSKFEVDLCAQNSKGLPEIMGNTIMCEASEIEFLMRNPLCLQSPGITIILVPHNFV